MRQAILMQDLEAFKKLSADHFGISFGQFRSNELF